LTPSHRSLKPIYFLFFLSGISGLVYETVWLRMLTRVLGSTVFATSVTLSAFMAGLALGSLLLGRAARNSRNLLQYYARLEVGVGLAALAMFAAVPALVPVYGWIYRLASGSRAALTAAQAASMFILLLVPTFLMGGTLPVLAAFTRAGKGTLARRAGLLYGFNTLGAVAGVLLSGLLTLGWLGERGTVLMGVALNFAIAVFALRMAAPDLADAGADPSAAAPEPGSRAWIPWLYAASGFTAIAYEVVWTRVFQIELGPSIYSFAMMLAFYLLGVGAGSLAGGWTLDRTRRPLDAFVLAQVFIAVYGLAGMFFFTHFEPLSNHAELTLRNMLLMPPLLVTPITFALGFIFPAISKAYVRDGGHVAGDIGLLYALNTVGCILGSLAAGFLFLDAFGSRGTMVLLSCANLLLAWAVIALAWRRLAGPRAVVTAVAATLACAALARRAPDPYLYAVDRTTHRMFGQVADRIRVHFHHETAQATTTTFSVPGLARSESLWINGVGMTILCTETKLMAHLPLLLHPDPRSFLAICFGMGTSLRSASRHPGLRCDAVELVPDVLARFPDFHADAAAVAADPRVRLYADDGRDFLATRDTRWDVISMDPPPPPWSAGCASLTSREFFALCRDHLTADGIMCLWVMPGSLSDGRMVVATFREVFPNLWVFGGPVYRGLFLIGMKGTGPLDPRRVLAHAGDPALVADLNEWDHTVPDPAAMLGLRVLGPRQAEAFTRGSAIITDDHPFTEFPIWRSRQDPDYRRLLDADSLARWREQVYVRR